MENRWIKVADSLPILPELSSRGYVPYENVWLTVIRTFANGEIYNYGVYEGIYSPHPEIKGLYGFRLNDGSWGPYCEFNEMNNYTVSQSDSGYLTERITAWMPRYIPAPYREEKNNGLEKPSR